MEDIINKRKYHRKNSSNKNLPENFFERIIEYEMKLKYDFSMETLNNLIEISSVKIELKKLLINK
jgi:hypothetical protein